MSDRMLHAAELIGICIAVVLFGIYLCQSWANAADITDEELFLDYAAIMQTACLTGDVEVGRDAAERRDVKIDNVDIETHWINLPYDCPFKTIDDILDAWVIRLEAGRPLVGGHYSDTLAVYVLPPDRKEK